MTINSLVGITNYGQPYVNAFWDGQKMVYGSGDAEYRPLSAGMDVVGHEMTHGVIEHSANLVYAGQSGAMNEAIADYFGNAIEADVYGIPEADPDGGLIGERLCRTKTPATVRCATSTTGGTRPGRSSESVSPMTTAASTSTRPSSAARCGMPAKTWAPTSPTESSTGP